MNFLQNPICHNSHVGLLFEFKARPQTFMLDSNQLC